MQLVRQHKLHMIGIKVDSKILEIFDFVNSKILNLEKIVIMDMWYFMNDTSIMFSYNTSNRTVGVNDVLIWDVLETEYGVEYHEIQNFLHYEIGRIYGWEIDITFTQKYDSFQGYLLSRSK